MIGAKFAVPLRSSSAAPERNASILESIFSKSNTPAIPMTQRHPNAPVLKPAAPIDTTVKITTLPSGLKVASADFVAPTIAVGVFVNAGPRFENTWISGISQFYEAIGLSSSTKKSEFRRARDLFANGSTADVKASRHHLSFFGESVLGPKSDVLAPTDFLLQEFADCLQNPAFLPEEVARAKEDTKEAVASLAKQQATQMEELIHAAAYSQNSLGLPLYGSDATIDSFTPEILREYASTFFVPSRLVVAGVGVKHDAFVQLVSKAFSTLPVGKPFPTVKAQYTGGDLRVDTRGKDIAHVAIAFETASWNDPDLVPMCVLQMMMGGGDSFSAGGPGKGMHSRLYTNVLNQYGWVESALSFNSLHSDSSIFGIQGSAPADHGKDLTAVLIDQARKMANVPTAVELTRAKNALKSAVFFQLEARKQQLDDMGSQVLFGSYRTPSELGRLIDAVSASDIQRVATKMLKTPVTFAASGNLATVPSIDTIRQALA